MKTPYSYMILRYVHDVVTGEFANVGVVVYAPSLQLLKSQFIKSTDRLETFFGKIDRDHLMAVLEHFGTHVSVAHSLDGIGGVVRKMLPHDDSSLQWSESAGGFTDDLEKTLQQLFERMIRTAGSS